MSIDPDFKEYLEDELDVLQQQIRLLTDRADRISAKLRQPSAGANDWKVEVLPPNPFARNMFNVITATTTMEQCRQALSNWSREATVKEIKAVIKHQTGREPAKSIVEMLRKRSADPRSGVYRVAAKGHPAKYGLTIWKETGLRNNDGSHSPAEEVIPDELLPR